MHISDQNRLENRSRVLQLAAIDMEQTIEAARAIEREIKMQAQGQGQSWQFTRALETAVAVCYWRPFTRSSTMGALDPTGDSPPEHGLCELHWSLESMRNEVYAHTDKSSGRDAAIRAGDEGFALLESWKPLPPHWLPSIIALAEAQRDRFRAEAFEIERKLGRLA